jgi:hypothetical protein
MRLAISGSHGTGKSTLVAAFLERCPDYRHEPEAFETVGDEVDVTSEGPTPVGLERLLEHTLVVVSGYPAGASVVFERSPVDYLAYAAASKEWPAGAAEGFLEAFVPRVRAAIRSLDLIALLPLPGAGSLDERPGEDRRFRKRVDAALRSALLDDEYDLFDGPGAPTVAELPRSPDRRLGELRRLARER